MQRRGPNITRADSEVSRARRLQIGKDGSDKLHPNGNHNGSGRRNCDVRRGAQGAPGIRSGSRSMKVGYMNRSAKNDQRDTANSKEGSPRNLRIGSRTEHWYRKYSLYYLPGEIVIPWQACFRGSIKRHHRNSVFAYRLRSIPTPEWLGGQSSPIWAGEDQAPTSIIYSKPTH